MPFHRPRRAGELAHPVKQRLHPDVGVHRARGNQLRRFLRRHPHLLRDRRHTVEAGDRLTDLQQLLQRDFPAALDLAERGRDPLHPLCAHTSGRRTITDRLQHRHHRLGGEPCANQFLCRVRQLREFERRLRGERFQFFQFRLSSVRTAQQPLKRDRCLLQIAGEFPADRDGPQSPRSQPGQAGQADLHPADEFRPDAEPTGRR